MKSFSLSTLCLLFAGESIPPWGPLSANSSNQLSVLAGVQPTPSRQAPLAATLADLCLRTTSCICHRIYMRRSDGSLSRWKPAETRCERKRPPSLLFTHTMRAALARRRRPEHLVGSNFRGQLKLSAGSLAVLPSETRSATQGSEQRPRLLAIYPFFVSSSF